MASGHVNRTNRPNTWLHRPTLRREDSPCQPGAVHTWPISSFRCDAMIRRLLEAERTFGSHPTMFEEVEIRNLDLGCTFATTL
jgi:hypothetical protein